MAESTAIDPQGSTQRAFSMTCNRPDKACDSMQENATDMLSMSTYILTTSTTSVYL